MTNNMKSFLWTLVLAVLLGTLVGIGRLIFGYSEGVSIVLGGLSGVGLITFYYKYWYEK